MTPSLLVSIVLAAAPGSAPAETRAEAYYHYSLGAQARLEGDTEQAIEEYRRALKIDPGAGAIRAELARALREVGKLDDALAEAEQAARLSPGDADVRRALAQLYRDLSHGSADGAATLRRAAEQYEEIVKLEPADPASLFLLTQIYTQLQDVKRASAALERYVALDPGNFEAHLRLGTMYLAQGDFDQAARSLKKALDLQPASSQVYASLGDVYAQAEQNDQAILHYRKALELEPGNLRLHLALGEVLMRARRHQEALAEADAVLAADARNAYGFDLRGRALRETKDFDGAWRAAQAALEQNPADLNAAYLKVTIAEARRDYAAAATLLEEMLKRPADPRRAPNTRLFLVHLGFAYQQLERPAAAAKAFADAQAAGGEPDATLSGYYVEALLRAKDPRALAEAQAARKRFPDDADLLGLEATIRDSQGDAKGAAGLIETLLRKSPKDASVLSQAAEFHQRGKRFGPAEALLLQARALEPKSLRVLFQLGAVLERQGRLDEAEATFREALLVEPSSAPVLNYLGYMNANRNLRVEEALGLIERAVALDPENGAYLDSLGWALFRLGRIEEAERHLRRAAEKQSDNAVVFDHLADALHQRGAVAEALHYWRLALEGGDEDGELDRKTVERKVREAEAVLAANPPPQ
jgi:tetratricopeptide (TPR) repeat protein